MTCQRPPRWRFATALGLLVGAGVSPAAAQSVTPTLFERTGLFAARHLTESSGVAVSRQYPGLLWTHNDSGHEPMVFATNLAGEDLGGYRLSGVSNVDWEDIALGPCPDGEGSCLYVADTGDNLESRTEVEILVLREPAPPTASRPYHRLQPRVLRLRYPDRPHDVEALAVTARAEVYLFTKGRSGSIMAFRVAPAAVLDDTATAVPVGPLPITPLRTFGQVVTGAAFSPGGDRVVVRAYTQLFFFARDRHGSFVAAAPPCWIGLVEPQGEGVDFLDAETLVLTSESAFGQPGGVSKVRCPSSEQP